LHYGSSKRAFLTTTWISGGSISSTNVLRFCGWKAKGRLLTEVKPVADRFEASDIALYFEKD